jgi:putative transposase
VLNPRTAVTPSTFAFEPEQWLARGEAKFRIVEVRAPLLIVEHWKSLERKAIDLTSLEREYLQGRVVPWNSDDPSPGPMAGQGSTKDAVVLQGLPLDMCSPAQQRHVTGILAWIDRLRKLGYRCLRPHPLLELDFEREKKGNPNLPRLALSTIYAWSLKLDRADGDARAIRPAFDERGGRGAARTQGEFEAELAAVFTALRADDSSKIEPHDVEDRIRQGLTVKYGAERTTVLMASRATISRRVKNEFTAYFIARRNKGKESADKEFRNWYPRDAAEWPLEVVEFDDKDSRVFLINEKTGLPSGRGHVTPGVDQHTGVPMGFSISEQPRSTWSAICALTNSILPSDPTDPDYQLVRSGAEYSGKMGIALFDNATYNYANEIELAGREIMVTPAWAKPYTPTEKSTVENFNGRMDAGYFSKQPGYGGPKGTTDRLTEAVECANASRDEFVRGLLKWAYDDYCNAPGETGLSPRQLWHQAMRHFRPRYPIDIYRLKIAPTLRHAVKLRPEGVRFCGLIYTNDRLTKLQRTIGADAEIEFRYDPRDLSQIYVFDAIAVQLFIVPSAQPEYTTGLTLYQHRLLRKMARMRGSKNPSTSQLMAEREALRLLVQQARWSKKKRERVVANRVGELGGAEAGAAPTAKKVPVTDLEGQVADIDDVEMELADEGWEVPAMI